MPLSPGVPCLGAQATEGSSGSPGSPSLPTSPSPSPPNCYQETLRAACPTRLLGSGEGVVSLTTRTPPGLSSPPPASRHPEMPRDTPAAGKGRGGQLSSALGPHHGAAMPPQMAVTHPAHVHPRGVSPGTDSSLPSSSCCPSSRSQVLLLVRVPSLLSASPAGGEQSPSRCPGAKDTARWPGLLSPGLAWPVMAQSPPNQPGCRVDQARPYPPGLWTSWG